MGLVTPEQGVRSLAVVIAELEECQPAMSGLLPQHAERVVLAEELRRGIGGEFGDVVHLHEAAQPPSGAAELARRVVAVEADARDLVGHGDLERERVEGERRIGPDHELVVGVGMSPVELARERHEIEVRPQGKPLSDGAGSAGKRGAGGRAQIYWQKRAGVARRDRRDPIRRRERRGIGVLHLDRPVREERRLHRDQAGRAEHAHAAPGGGERIGAGANEYGAADRGIQVGQKRRDARSAFQQPRDVAVGARAVGFAERDVAVGVHERDPLCRAVEAEAERQTLLHAVIVAQRDTVADRQAEGGIDPDHVVPAAGPEHEVKTAQLDVEGIRQHDEIAFILNHCHVTDIRRHPRSDHAERREPTPLGCGTMVPEDVEDRAAWIGISQSARCLRGLRRGRAGLRRGQKARCRTGVLRCR